MGTQGLSQGEAIRRLQEEGYNELPSSKPKTLRHFLFELIQEPMVFLLLGCGGVYLVLGDPQEALLLLGFLFLTVCITAAQELKAERSLEALRDLSSPRALVIRDGMRKRIPGREVVRGDWVIVQEGDRIPADGQVIQCETLEVDESLLTGESAPVIKNGIGLDRRAGAPRLFAATTVVRGQAWMEVIATGPQTEFGKIGKSIALLGHERTHLENQTTQVVRSFAIFAAFLCVVLVVAYGLTRGHWLNGFLAGLTLAMAILPNELPAVLTAFLALGAWRMAKRRVLTRRMAAIENLGAATVLCVDKTGTLTVNRMTIQKLFADDSFYDVIGPDLALLPEQFHEILEFGILASREDPFDPMERAFVSAGNRFLKGTEHLHSDWIRQREYPLSAQLMAISYAWLPHAKDEWMIGAKGAPEAVMDLCHLGAEQIQALSKRVSQMAVEGLRVIGVAKAHFTRAELPPKQHDFEFKWVGLVGLADPVRPEVPQAVEDCRVAGVRVIMMTGDHPQTAQWIGRQIGFGAEAVVVSGAELDQLSDSQLQETVRQVQIFSRVRPEQKLRIVEALRNNGEVVAMTGDGVNDAPALRGAQVGIAMGGRGTDVAREASSLVLLDDDFASIVDAIRMGRRIYSNIQSAFVYLLAVHIPIAGMSVLPVFLNLPLVLLPVHIAFLHLIIEPVCSIVFEAEPSSPEQMRRPPRHPNSSLLTRYQLTSSLIQGTSILFTLMAISIFSLYRGQGEEDARTLTFTSLVFSNLTLILTSRTLGSRGPRKNQWTTGVILVSLVLLIAVLYSPELRQIFRFSYLYPMDLLICGVSGGLSVLWVNLLSRLRRQPR